MFINILSFLVEVIPISRLDPSVLSQFRMQLKHAFDKIKFQFEEHLEAINENTNEIQANYNLLKELEEKIERLREKIEHVQLHLSHISPDFAYKSDSFPFEIQPLSINEKRVLVILLASKKFLSYGELAKVLNMSESLVRSYITNMIEKGVPLVKKYIGGKPLINVDEKFKEIQETQDIAHLAQRRLNSF